MSLSVDSLYNAIVYKLSEVFYEMQVLHAIVYELFGVLYEIKELHVIVYELS